MSEVAQGRARAKRPVSSPSSLTTRSAAPESAPPESSPASAPRRKTQPKRANGAGSVRWRNGRAEARLSLGEAGRRTIALPTCRTEKEAEARRVLLAELGAKLVTAGKVILGFPLLERAGARDGKALEDVKAAIDALCRGEARQRPSGEISFKEFAEQHWLSGELAKQHPDRVRTIKAFASYRAKLEKYVYPHVGSIPLSRFTLDHADHVMSSLPANLEAGTRRSIAKVLHRALSLAAYPAKIIAVNPLPRGWLPKVDEEKAKGYLYPDEERRLMQARAVPLCSRVFYGFLTREGMRSDEARRLEWDDLDLDRGAVRLDQNKTNDPRAWALSPDVVRALRAWRKLCPSDRFVFVNAQGLNRPESKAAERFRAHLQQAGVNRPELFEHGKTRLRIRLHDTRATFITVKLANGRTETWIADRTGHASSEMINTYRRAARTAAELGLGDLAPMDEAIPELAERRAAEGGGGAQSGGACDKGTSPGGEPGTSPEGAGDGGALGPRWAKPEAAAPQADAGTAATQGCSTQEVAPHGKVLRGFLPHVFSPPPTYPPFQRRSHGTDSWKASRLFERSEFAMPAMLGMVLRRAARACLSEASSRAAPPKREPKHLTTHRSPPGSPPSFLLPCRGVGRKEGREVRRRGVNSPDEPPNQPSSGSCLQNQNPLAREAPQSINHSA